MANSSNNPNIARQAYDASQFAVNRANNVATGRLPNIYTPYYSNGNPYSYFNSSRQTGKTPSPDAPRVEDVSEEAENTCNRSEKSAWITSVMQIVRAGLSNLAEDQAIDQVLNAVSSILKALNPLIDSGAVPVISNSIINDLNSNIFSSVQKGLNLLSKSAPVIAGSLLTGVSVYGFDNFCDNNLRTPVENLWEKIRESDF